VTAGTVSSANAADGHRVVIVGGGFAGVEATTALAGKAASSSCATAEGRSGSRGKVLARHGVGIGNGTFDDGADGGGPTSPRVGPPAA
jgi:hypothetical protein